LVGRFFVVDFFFASGEDDERNFVARRFDPVLVGCGSGTS
jgi:hypothetical protein